MKKRIVVSTSAFRKKKSGMYMDMVLYKDSEKGTSETKHEISKDQTKKFYKK